MLPAHSYPGMLIWCDAQWLAGQHAYTEGLGEKEQQALAASGMYFVHVRSPCRIKMTYFFFSSYFLAFPNIFFFFWVGLF